jgi:carbamoyltransferase
MGKIVVMSSGYFLSIFSGHDASFTIANRQGVLEVVELERLYGIKHVGIHTHHNGIVDSVGHNHTWDLSLISNYLKQNYNVTSVDHLFIDVDFFKFVTDEDLNYHFKASVITKYAHHHAHAACAFFQSPFDEALIISADGGGSDGVFNIFVGKKGQPLKKIQTIDSDLGSVYMFFGQFMGDIKLETSLKGGSLIYPGKIMGLAPYGNVREEWVPLLVDFFKSNEKYRLEEPYFTKERIDQLSNDLGVPLDIYNRLKGQDQYDLAATVQYAFERAFLFFTNMAMIRYLSLPICLAGGCALNITMNTKIVQDVGRQVFVPPNPNDSGLSLGIMLNHLKPQQFDATYMGSRLYDIDTLPRYIRNASYAVDKATPVNIVKDLIRGDIIGVARGRAELGPRALGNRSIICNPQYPGMKDTINAKVKHREWYRPFAPIVRLEDVNRYFEWDKESRFMSFAPLVRKKYRDILPSITHIDGTARVQTVTREQNAFMYDLLTEMDKQTGIGVLLNTSFNVDSKPILSTVSEAFEVLNNTSMDGIVIEDYYIRK